jgi:hypothetical protein
MCCRSKKSTKKGDHHPMLRMAGVPKEAVPLVVLLRQKKKHNEDVGKLADECMKAIGG